MKQMPFSKEERNGTILRVVNTDLVTLSTTLKYKIVTTRIQVQVLIGSRAPKFLTTVFRVLCCMMGLSHFVSDYKMKEDSRD